MQIWRDNIVICYCFKSSNIYVKNITNNIYKVYSSEQVIVKVKFTLELATTAQRGNRVIAFLFL